MDKATIGVAKLTAASTGLEIASTKIDRDIDSAMAPGNSTLFLDVTRADEKPDRRAGSP